MVPLLGSVPIPSILSLRLIFPCLSSRPARVSARGSDSPSHCQGWTPSYFPDPFHLTNPPCPPNISPPTCPTHIAGWQTQVPQGVCQPPDRETEGEKWGRRAERQIKTDGGQLGAQGVGEGRTGGRGTKSWWEAGGIESEMRVRETARGRKDAGRVLQPSSGLLCPLAVPAGASI